MKPILFDRIDEPSLNTLDVYQRRGGYDGLRRALTMSPEAVVAEIMASGIRGRGGAGFQMGRKLSFLPHGDMEKYLVCNADESEPGTFKDRELMQKSPHMLIEGIAIAAYAGRSAAASSTSAASTSSRPTSWRRPSRRRPTPASSVRGCSARTSA